MDPATVAFLASPEGAEYIASTGPVPDDRLLEVVERLRRTLDRDRAAAVVETIRLRERAVAKFSDPGVMLFTADGLEQASPEPCSNRRAAAFAGVDLVADLGCGIGADARALSIVSDVVAVDIDVTSVAIARHNLGGAGHVVVGNATSPPLDIAGAGVFLDPARRADGRRLTDAETWSPPLSAAIGVARRSALGAVKVAPGLDHSSIPGDAVAEWVSLDAGLRECVLWFGTGGDPSVRKAVDAGSGEEIAEVPHTDGPVGSIGSWLHEPDPAVIRSGLVANLAERLGLRRIDHRIAYLSGEAEVSSALLRSYRVESVSAFNLKALRAHLRGLGVGSVTVKKRGSPLDPDQLRRELDLRGDRHRVVVLTRIGDDPVVVVALEPDQSGRAQT